MLLMCVCALAFASCNDSDVEEDMPIPGYDPNGALSKAGFENVHKLLDGNNPKSTIEDVEYVWDVDSLIWREEIGPISSYFSFQFMYNISVVPPYIDHERSVNVDYMLVKEDFGGRKYSRVYRNGVATDMLVRPEGKKLYGYDVTTESEFVIYDFTVLPEAPGRFVCNLFVLKDDKVKGHVNVETVIEERSVYVSNYGYSTLYFFFVDEAKKEVEDISLAQNSWRGEIISDYIGQMRGRYGLLCVNGDMCGTNVAVEVKYMHTDDRCTTSRKVDIKGYSLSVYKSTENER